MRETKNLLKFLEKQYPDHPQMANNVNTIFINCSPLQRQKARHIASSGN